MPRTAATSEDTIREILTSYHLTHSAMARRIGRTHQFVSQVRLGQCCCGIAPDLPRWVNAPTCDRCQHWTGERCDLGFPDPLDEGLRFAASCSVFREGK